MKNVKQRRRFGTMTIAGILMSTTLACAGPQAMFGLSYNWGGSTGWQNLGVSVKVVSDNEKDQVIAAAGLSYYPWSPADKFGADLSGGYLFDSFALTAGWDFLQNGWIVSAGYVNTVDGDGGDPSPDPEPTSGSEETDNSSSSEPPASEPGGSGAGGET